MPNPAGNCPCSVDVYFRPTEFDPGLSVGGFLTTHPLVWFGVGNFTGRILHSALRVEPGILGGERLCDDGSCPFYSIEIATWDDDPGTRAKRGIVRKLRALGPGLLGNIVRSAGASSALRRARCQQPLSFDFSPEGPAKGYYVRRVSTDCKVAKCILDRTPGQVPDIGYGASCGNGIWACNSVTTWLLQTCGVNAFGLAPNYGDFAPGLDEGRREAERTRPRRPGEHPMRGSKSFVDALRDAIEQKPR